LSTVWNSIIKSAYRLLEGYLPNRLCTNVIVRATSLIIPHFANTSFRSSIGYKITLAPIAKKRRKKLRSAWPWKRKNGKQRSEKNCRRSCLRSPNRRQRDNTSNNNSTGNGLKAINTINPITMSKVCLRCACIKKKMALIRGLINIHRSL